MVTAEEAIASLKKRNSLALSSLVGICTDSREGDLDFDSQYGSILGQSIYLEQLGKRITSQNPKYKKLLEEIQKIGLEPMPYKILGKDYAMIAVGLVYEREQEAQKAAGTRS